MDCAQVEANLTDFLDGLLEPAAEAAALEHLATCERCDLVLTQTRAVIDLAGEHGRVVLAASEREDLLARIVGDQSLSD